MKVKEWAPMSCSITTSIMLKSFSKDEPRLNWLYVLLVSSQSFTKQALSCALSDRQAYERTRETPHTTQLVPYLGNLAILVDVGFLRNEFLDRRNWHVLRYWFSSFVLMRHLIATPCFHQLSPSRFRSAAIKESRPLRGETGRAKFCGRKRAFVWGMVMYQGAFIDVNRHFHTKLRKSLFLPVRPPY